MKDQLGFEVYRAHQNETEWLNEAGALAGLEFKLGESGKIENQDTSAGS